MDLIDIHINKELIAYIEAVVDDMILTHSQTRFEPAEYGPAKCFSFIDLNDIIENDDELQECLKNPTDFVKNYLESIKYDVDWKLSETDDY